MTSRTIQGPQETVPTVPVLIGRILLLVAALAAVAAVVTGAPALGETGPETLIVETWRVAGLGVFAGLFALLAYRPLHYAGVWELVVANKLVLTVVALSAAPDTTDAGITAAVDGSLTAVLVAAYLLCRGWRAWAHVTPDPNTDVTVQQVAAG